MLLLSLVIVFSLCFFTEGTLAFNKQNARSYADQYAIHNNTYGYRTFASDCTNFVSQVMKSGGLSTGPHWYYNSGMNYSATWTVADQLKNHIRDHGVGTKIGSWSKNGTGGSFITYAYIGNSNNLSGGDEVIFYDWDGDGTMNHASFCVRTGTDSDSGYYGDLINQHTTNRKNAIWHLDPYNYDRYTTRVYAFRIY